MEKPHVLSLRKIAGVNVDLPLRRFEHVIALLDDTGWK